MLFPCQHRTATSAPVLPLLVLIAVGVGLGIGCGEQSPGPVVTPAAVAAAPKPAAKLELGAVASLSTQWYPQANNASDETENPLARELVRQGVLMAMREELGLVTRDETLGEPLTTSEATEAGTTESPSEPFALEFDVDKSGTWNAALSGAGVAADNPVWKHDGKIKFNKRTIYAELAKQIADESGTIAEQLRKAGAKGEPTALNPQNTPTADEEKLLAEMNFVSQYAAVRAAHLAMAENGPSLEWMGVLVRGYANLALLTEHTWSSQQDAFAARSLLYAERMLDLSEDSELAQWHRAYALAVVGAHGAALDQLESLKTESGATTEDASDEKRPAWTELIVPYVEFNQDELTSVAAKHPDLGETAALLRWHVYHSYMHGRWIHEKGLEAMQVCPEAYSVYSVLSNWSALMIKRIGASAGMSAFGEHLPARVAKLTNLSEATRAFTAPQSSLLSRMLGTRQDAALSDRPAKIARTLRTATAEETKPTECSWAILAGLIEDEQLIQAANVLTVSGDGVEHSSESLVEQLVPLVEDHRYAAFVRSFSASRRNTAAVAEHFREVTVVDPRPNMKRLFVRAWHTPMANGRNGNELAWRTLWTFNHTQSGLLQTAYEMVDNWNGGLEATKGKFGKEFQLISPQSSNAVRLRWEGATIEDAKQLAKWESELGEDPVGWLTLGQKYYALNDLDAATRCYRRSLDISPCYDATVGLANCYYYNGKKELWQPTLETYLEVQDLGLAHAQIHQLIAEERISERAWSEAEQHALEAAGTYSAWGLALAGRLYEGKQDWEKSEHFIAEAAKHYPSSSAGTGWYFWCRRTGRGDIEEARALAERSVEIAEATTYYNEACRAFVYRLIEGDPSAALAGLEGQLARCKTDEAVWDKAWRLLHAIAIAKETGKPDQQQEAISQLRALAEGEIKMTDPDWLAVIDGLCRAFEGEKLDAEFLKKYDETITNGSADGRCNYQYFMGVALDSQGLTTQADDYWRRAAFGGPFANFNATLAGHRLVERHGPERGGIPAELAERDAQQEAAAQAAAEGGGDADDDEDADAGANDRSI